MKEGEQQDTSSKVKQSGGTKANIVKASSLAKEAEDVLIAGSNRTYSDGESREDKCSNGATPTIRDRV